MTFKEQFDRDFPDNKKKDITLFGCPFDYGYEASTPCKDPTCRSRPRCRECWNREMPFLKKESTSTGPHILDSGDMRVYPSGAIRGDSDADGQPKGRCDLMPLRVLASIWRAFDTAVEHIGVDKAVVFDNIANFQDTGDTRHLELAIHHFVGYLDYPTAFLEVAKHFEEGAKKYGENNWQKGLPVHRYIDSAVRHYLKWLRGDQDEPHDRAFVWNLICCIWEVDFSPRAKEKGTPVAEEATVYKANPGVFYICNRKPCATCRPDCHSTIHRGDAAVLELYGNSVRYEDCPIGLFMHEVDGVFLKTEIINAETGQNTAVHIGLGLSRKFEPDATVFPIKHPFEVRDRV